MKKIYWIVSQQYGIDPVKFIKALIATPKYVLDWMLFSKEYKGVMVPVPCMHDKNDEAGATKDEYFIQDLIVAQEIKNKSPVKHVDIGSRIDGFVAHVAAFREIEVFDIREVKVKVSGIVFKQADLMRLDDQHENLIEYCDSLSCLHAVEHFGLGRYGDPINSVGYKLGIHNMLTMLSRGGDFYLSCPIGKPRVEFNANHIFLADEILKTVENEGMILDKILVVKEGCLLELERKDIVALSEKSYYSLGIFFFIKK